MSKALVINGVNFSTNALTQVTFGDEIPCTALSLSESTKSLTDLTSFTLTATKTPNNTTDNLTWSSSNDSIATVADGVVTPLAVGSVTITATCGEQTATCAVTISIFLNPYMLFHYYYSIASSGSGNSIKVDGGTSASSGASVKTDGTGARAYDSSSKLPAGTYAYPIYLPSGCTGISVKVPNQSMKVSACWCDSQTESGYGSNYIHMTSYEASPWDSSIPAGDRVIYIPSGISADCFYLNAYLSGNTLSQEMLEEITVEALFNTPA